MARSLLSLQEEFRYQILSEKQVAQIRDGSINWNSVEGELIRQTCLRSYPAYLQLVNDPYAKGGYTMTAYHYSMAANLQRHYEQGPNAGCAYSLVLLSAPPQTGKSLTVSESFPSWVLMKNPKSKVIALGYGADFAIPKFGQKNRDKFARYAPILSWNALKIHDKMQSAGDWGIMQFDRKENNWLPIVEAMHTDGIYGGVTGHTGNLIIIDDPIKGAEAAQSETQMDKLMEEFVRSIESRLVANVGSMCIIMCTRWVVDDLIGWCRKNRKDFIVGDYNYAALCTEENKHKDPLSREIGEGICPENGQDGAWANSYREALLMSEGLHVYNAMYQGEPSDEQGNLLKEEDWQEYEIDTLKLEDCDRVYLSIDASFKDNKNSDFVAMTLGAVKNGNDYLRYLVHKRMDMPATLDKILEICKKFPEIDNILIEDKANGPAIISVLRKWRRKLGSSSDYFPSVVPVEPKGGKYARAQAAAPYQRDGRCFIPCEKDAHLLSSPEDFEWDEKGLSYVQCFKQQMSTFPYGRNDDIVDAWSQAILKNIPILTGEETPIKKITRFSRYSKWHECMWEDYKKLKNREDKKLFIRMHGAPIEWKPKDDIWQDGVI